MLALVVSLLFGAGQVAAGALLVRFGLHAGRWRRARVHLAMGGGVWLVTSGLAELVVSGMATTQQILGAPGAAVLASWRARADDALLIVSVLVVGAVLARPLLLWARAHVPRAARHADE